MNKAAAKEPSMDEILSSIRQIIADDDDSAVARSTTVAPEPDPVDELMADAALSEDEDDALELSTAQIVEEDAGFDLSDIPGNATDDDVEDDIAEIVEPDDISFDTDSEELEAFAEPEQIIEDEPVAQTAAMPDPTLSSDMADQLLEPATGAAIKSTFAKLSNVALGAHNMTIENMIREMLRPMLKDWLDENLPSVVEKMVEKEIERISRGG